MPSGPILSVELGWVFLKPLPQEWTHIALYFPSWDLER